jgi:hypothetical protein
MDFNSVAMSQNFIRLIRGFEVVEAC